MMNLRKLAFYLVLLCMIWFPMQDTVLSFLYRIYSGNYLFILLILKEILIIISLCLLVFNFILTYKLPFSKIEIFSFIYIAICFFYFFSVKVEGSNIIAASTSLRSLLLPVLLVLVGKFLMLSKKEIEIFVNTIIGMSIFSIFFGFIEITVPVEKFWNGIMDLYGFLTEIKGMSLHHFVKFVPGNFWGFVGERRMAGLHGSPLALGYYLVLPFLITCALNKYRKEKSMFKFFILTIGIFLTETRMAIISTLLGLVLLFKEEVLNFLLRHRIKKIAFFGFLVFVFLCFLFLFTFSSRIINFLYKTITIKEGRAIGHLNALKKSISVVDKFIIKGAGIGTAGAWASIYGSEIKGMASENVYIPLMVQIGGMGLILFLLWWYNCLKRLFLRYKQEEESYLRKLIKAVLVANIVYFISGFVSEQILTFTSVAHFWLLFGILIGYKR